MTLALMNRLGVRPTIVLAPLQPWYLSAISGHGWDARHHLVLAYLHELAAHLSLQRAGLQPARVDRGLARGLLRRGPPATATTRLVVRAVLRSLPQAFAPSRTARS